MQTLNEPPAPADFSSLAAGTPEPQDKIVPGSEPLLAEAIATTAAKTTPVQIVLIVLGAMAFLYFARPVVLPVFLACVAGMTLKPLIRWSTCCRMPPALSAAVVLCLLLAGIVIGSLQLGRPALTWMNEAPQHMTELRQRFQKVFPRAARISQAAVAVNNLGATDEEKKQAPTVEVKDSRGTTSILNWTGTLLAGVGETLVLLYLLLASGDLFLQRMGKENRTGKER
jgi:predicted PurR-regulated permease PerM